MTAGAGTPLSRLTLLFCVAALAWGAGLAFLYRGGALAPLDGVEGASLDLRFRMRGSVAPPGDLVIVAIDDATVAATGYPPPRAALAELVRTIGASKPKAVAVDLLLLEPGEQAADDALAAALAATPSVVAAAAVFPPEAAAPAAATTDGVPAATHLKWPAPIFADAARVGVANLATDPSGSPRHMPLLVSADGGLVPGFALAAAATAAEAPPRFGPEDVTVGEARQPLDIGRHLALSYYGPAGTIPTRSAEAILAAAGPPADLAGRIVVIGTTALASGDTFPTPFDGNLTGVEVLATGIGNLLAGDGLVRDTAVRRLDVSAAVLLPLLVVVLMTIGSPAAGLALAAAAVAAWLVVAYLAFLDGYWLAVALPLAAALPTAVAFGTARHLAGEAAAGRVIRSRDALARLQAPLVAERLSRDPDFLAVPLERQAAILFLDLSGFTGLSERLGPHHTRDFLDGFHAAVAAATDAAGGLLVAFLGDGAMILFGFDEGGPVEAERALAAIGRYADGLGALIDSHPPAAGMTVRFGVHYGPVILSRLGGATQQSITVAGDTVNVASRLVELAKQHRAAAAVSSAVFAAAGGVPDGFGPAQPVAVRGRRSGLVVRFRAVARPDPPGAGDGGATGA